MRLISILILIMYLSVAINGIAYAGANMSVGVGVLNLNSLAGSVCNQDCAQIAQFSNNLSIKNAFTDFTQNLPQMQGYNWMRVKQENKKLISFLAEI